MIAVNLAEAKKHLAHYTRLVKGGSVVVLCERNKPIAEIRPLGHPSVKRPKRKIGLMKGLCPIGLDFLKGPENSENISQRGVYENVTDLE